MENSFHPSQTSKWAQQSKREKWPKKMKWKRKRRYNVYFDPMTWISSKQQYFIAATLALWISKRIFNYGYLNISKSKNHQFGFFGGKNIQNQRVTKFPQNLKNWEFIEKLGIGNKFKTSKNQQSSWKNRQRTGGFFARFFDFSIFWEPWLHTKTNYLKFLKTDKWLFTWSDNRRVSVPHSKNCPTLVEMSLILCKDLLRF